VTYFSNFRHRATTPIYATLSYKQHAVT